MQIEGLSWYPGHMTKTKRMIVAEMGHMDAVCEILDARIPISSRNPDVDEMTAGKPRLVVLNRVTRLIQRRRPAGRRISGERATQCWSPMPKTAWAQPSLPPPCGSC